MLGLHWVFDLSGCDRGRLTRGRVLEVLNEVPRLLGLETVGPPELSEHTDAARRASIAGVVLLRESHASCHCFPDSGTVHLDVFCCRAVDFEPAARFATEHFGASDASGRVLERGDFRTSGSLERVVRRLR